MNHILATLIVGLGGTAIAGGIGLISAILSYRMAQRQLARQTKENELNRKYQTLILLQPKHLEAIETVWKLLFNIEQNSTLTEEELNSFIRAIMWLKPTTRSKSLDILAKYHKQSVDLSTLELQSLRQELIQESGVNEICTLLNSNRK